MAMYIQVNIGSVNGLLPDDPELLPEPTLSFYGIDLAILPGLLKISVHDVSLKITHLMLQRHPQGSDELTHATQNDKWRSLSGIYGLCTILEHR